MSDAPELKPCPFCGGAAITTPSVVDRQVLHTHCRDHHCPGWSVSRVQPHAWNYRSDLCASGQQVMSGNPKMEKSALERLAELRREVTDEPLHVSGRYFNSHSCTDLTRCGYGGNGEFWNPADGKAISILWGLWRDGAFDTMTPAPQEPEAVRHSFDGDGWLYADRGNGSDWLERALNYPDAEPLYAHPPKPSVSVAEVEHAFDEIRELNMSGRDENGHRWANSDLIDQTVTTGLIALRALKGDTDV